MPESTARAHRNWKVDNALSLPITAHPLLSADQLPFHISVCSFPHLNWHVVDMVPTQVPILQNLIYLESTTIWLTLSNYFKVSGDSDCPRLGPILVHSLINCGHGGKSAWWARQRTQASRFSIRGMCGEGIMDISRTKLFNIFMSNI